MRKSRKFLAGLLMLALAITTLIPSAIPAQAVASVNVSLAASQTNLVDISNSGNSYTITYKATAATDTTKPIIILEVLNLTATTTDGDGYQATIEYTGGTDVKHPTSGTGTSTDKEIRTFITLPALNAGGAVATITDLGAGPAAVKVLTFTYKQETVTPANKPKMKNYTAKSVSYSQPSGYSDWDTSFSSNKTNSEIDLTYYYDYYYGITSGCNLVYAFVPEDMGSGGSIKSVGVPSSSYNGASVSVQNKTDYVLISLSNNELRSQTISIPVTYAPDGVKADVTVQVQVNLSVSQLWAQLPNSNPNMLTMGNISQNPTTVYVGDTVTLSTSLAFTHGNIPWTGGVWDSNYSDVCVYSPVSYDVYQYHFYRPTTGEIFTAYGWQFYQHNLQTYPSSSRTFEIYNWSGSAGSILGNPNDITIDFKTNDTANSTIERVSAQSAKFKATKAGEYIISLSVPSYYQLSNASAGVSSTTGYPSQECVYTPNFHDGYSYHFFDRWTGNILTSVGWVYYGSANNLQIYSASQYGTVSFWTGTNPIVGSYGQTRTYKITVLPSTGSTGGTSSTGDDLVIIDDNADGTLKKGSRVGLPIKKPLPITNASGTSLGTLNAGFVIITGSKTSSNRLPISYDGGTAYAVAPYVNVLSGTLEADAKIMQCTAKNYVSLRTAAKSSATRLEKITAEQLVIAYPSITSGAYIKVMYNGKTGWAESKYLKDY